MVDFPHVAAQLGHDLFNGEGWEAYDRVRKTLHDQKIEEAMGIKFLKKSKPESERVEDDTKVRVTVEETLKEIELRGDIAVKALSQGFDGYAPEKFKLNESEILAAMQKVSRVT